LKAWEEASIAGFAKVDVVTLDVNYRLIFRKNLDDAAPDIVIAEEHPR